ncbi:sensor histidine kinase [Actinomadura madurae]|uniref:sensor histidine kinase n=1 Tax=Actinomadura madurae TaxID=1993 RepID=UPI0020D257FF|nr:HAMP domain-containing sensor histidine kinase [Actinomadura madurae]MCP9954751.1 HAMP domain-containing histidine kinase [Actinomadura madurae]MCQ0020214.1 HAMP domain-containing histidine kinase [Actinomadura madurae]
MTRRRWFSGLRIRLAAAFTAVALLASVLASGLSYVLMRRVMLQPAQDAVLTDVRDTLVRQVPVALPPDAGPLIGAAIRDALGADGRKAVTVPVRGEPAPPRDGALDVPVTREFVRRAMRGWSSSASSGTARPTCSSGPASPGHQPAREPWRTTPPMVFVSASLRREAADLRLFTRTLLLADAAALGWRSGWRWWPPQGVLRPVRRLGAAARALGQGRLETRVRVRGRDELADLARTFNGTADALERTVTELRAMEAASRRFVADVSHELRTPLTSMIAMTDVLAEEADPAEGGAAARLVAGETRRLGVLVEHLIEISRFDAGAAALVLDDVNVADAIDATLRARGWREELAVGGPADLFVRLDPRRFDVIVANLAGNALKHGRPPVSLCFGRRRRRPGAASKSSSPTGAPACPTT